MSTVIVAHEPPTRPELTLADPREPIFVLVTTYASFVLVGLALVPAFLIAYLFFFQDPALVFQSHPFHIVAIGIASLEGFFIAYVTWLCYRSSGEPLLRWMTLGFLGFTLIYALHGAFTGFANSNIWLFLLYGPASRLVLAMLLLCALLSYHRPVDAADRRMSPRPWVMWTGVFMLVDLAVALVANSSIAGNPALRLSMEGGALALSAMNVMLLLLRRIRSPLMVIFAISITAFALSSLAFMLGRPWNHMWWLAHAIFAAAFFMLSFGVAQAFRTTRSFSTIYSQEELMARLARSMASTQDALREVKLTNQALERLAATDSLTGAENRRRFFERTEAEVERVGRGGAPFSVLALDLDNFKSINDRYGHPVGDDVLKEVVQRCLRVIRSNDSVARVGGEEFMVLLPNSALEAARVTAERLRSSIASNVFVSGVQHLADVTVSIGVSQFGRDGADTVEAILRMADERMYIAKQLGRDRVISA
ncbi:GGDEF domain-containing protein [Roseateles sp.]|uniref:GGDEF domain-containing protein n=1 Tax=Roseateles sp. TaxID=1971397 RepID=UPI0032665E43